VSNIDAYNFITHAVMKYSFRFPLTVFAFGESEIVFGYLSHI